MLAETCRRLHWNLNTPQWMSYMTMYRNHRGSQVDIRTSAPVFLLLAVPVFPIVHVNQVACLRVLLLMEPYRLIAVILASCRCAKRTSDYQQFKKFVLINYYKQWLIHTMNSICSDQGSMGTCLNIAKITALVLRSAKWSTVNMCIPCTRSIANISP